MASLSPARNFWSPALLGWWILHLSLGAPPEVPPTPLLEASLRPALVPFEDGEKLRYEVNWRPLPFMPAVKAGEVDFQIRREKFEGTPVYRITAQARSRGLLASLGMEIEDDFESIVDARDFRSLRFIHRKRHSNRKRYLEMRMNYEAGYAVVREIDLADSPARTISDQRIEAIPGAVSDVVSVFYAGRLRELLPEHAYLIHLHDNGRIKQVPVRVEAIERVRSGLDSHDSVRLRTEDGIFRGGGHFLIWYSRDDFRLPVRFEASAKLGRVFGQLILIETPRFSKARVRVS